jgi:protein SCO1/2
MKVILACLLLALQGGSDVLPLLQSGSDVSSLLENGRSRNRGAAFVSEKRPDVASTIKLDQKLGAQVPLELRFFDEFGRPVRLGKYLGPKPAILVLAYYECPNLCTVVLNGLLDTACDLRFDAGKDYQIVVVSIDPRERPALALSKKQTYVRRYGRKGGESGWHFLTGGKEAIDQLAQSVGFQFAWDESSGQFAHPSSLIVLTPEGKVSRYFPGIEYPPKEVRLALVEASNHRIGSLADRFFLLCFHYNPHTGKYGLLIWRAMQLGGCGTALVLFAGIGMLLRRERKVERAMERRQ